MKSRNITKIKEYKVYSSMKQRCYNENCKEYKNYGGRGIKVCNRWLENKELFFEDMGPRPTKKHSLDRIDNNGDYCPENCRWATREEQNNNKRSNIKITFNGVTKNLSEWAKDYNCCYQMISRRLENGWSIEDAITKPSSYKGNINKLIEFNGESKTIIEWSVVLDCKPTALYKRLEKGWSIEKTLSTPVKKYKERNDK